jgi:hypothetical protein
MLLSARPLSIKTAGGRRTTKNAWIAVSERHPIGPGSIARAVVNAVRRAK